MKWTKLTENKKLVVFFMVGFAIIGALTLRLTKAASPNASLETSQGKISLNATTVKDAQASDGSVVRFGPATPTGAPILNGKHFNETQVVDLVNRTAGYDSLEVDITPEVEQGTSAGYFFANTVFFTNYTGTNNGSAYAGIQTNGSNGTANIGHMALFSVWDVTGGIAEPGGIGIPFSGEGTGYSVRIPYAWQVNHTYRLKIYTDSVDSNSGLTLWAAGLTDLQTGTTTRIGRIYVPTARGKIQGPVMFHERFATSSAPQAVTTCSAMTPTRVTFTNASANNGAIHGTNYSHYYRANDAACPGMAYIQNLANGFRSSVNAP